MTFSITQRRTLSWLTLGLILGLLLWVLAPVLTPFVIGAVMAYALEPAVAWLVRKRVPRLLAVIVVSVVVLLIMVSIVFLVVPIISNQVPLLRQQVPLMLDRLNTTVPPWLAQWGMQISVDTSSAKAFLLKFLNANLEEWVRTALSSARLGGSILMTVIGTLILVPLVLFYLLMDWPQLVKRINDLVPPRLLNQTHEIFLEVDDILGQYLRGQLLVMLAMACYYSVGLALFGFHLALPVGVFTGAAMCIPYLGFGVGLFLALFAGVLQFTGWYGLMAVAVVYGLGQVLESFFLTPRLVGERIGMHPLVVIFALLAFGNLFGFVGVLVALPVSAVLVVAIRRLKAAYLASKLYAGLDS